MVVEVQKHDKVEVFCDWVLELLKIFFPSFNLHSIQKQCEEYSNLQRHKLTLHLVEIERGKTFVKVVFLKQYSKEQMIDFFGPSVSLCFFCELLARELSCLIFLPYILQILCEEVSLKLIILYVVSKVLLGKNFFFLHLVHTRKLLLLIFNKLISKSQKRIQYLFQIGYGFWAHKNRHPNFDRSIKDVILILSNSRWTDLNKETQV